MFVFLGYVLSENDPSFEQSNKFVYGQMVSRGCKTLKMSCLEFHTDFASSKTCQNFRQSCKAVSVPFHSATVEMCVQLVGRLAVILSVCPVSNVPFVLLPQETQTFRLQSRQGEGRRSVVNSAKSAVVVPVSVPREIQQKSAKWTESSFYMGRFIAFCPFEPPLKACTTMVFEPVELAHSEKKNSPSTEAFEENELMDA